MTEKLDMTAMYAMHAALRREVEQLARVTAREDDDPRKILAMAVGWEIFKRALHVHHSAEDDALWPPMRKAVTGRPDDLVLLAAMEDEHSTIDPIIEAIDATLTDRASAPSRLADLIANLATALTAHLKHEEDEALPLIQAMLPIADWQHFGETHARLVGPDAPRVVPWLLDGADETTVKTILAPLPEPVRKAYQDQWLPAYRAQNLWNA